MILTSDAATILRELDVVHPAAKLLVMASQQQDAEMGDGTNLVIVLAGELLKKAEELIRLGLKTSDIVSGYEKAQNFALKVLEGMIVVCSLNCHWIQCRLALVRDRWYIGWYSAWNWG
jgi:T-complex protein 1 subunit theta